MINFKNIKYDFYKIYALTEKSIKLKLRFKYNIIFGFITPLFGIITPLIIMKSVFNFNTQFGPWTEHNFLIYQFVAYSIILLRNIISEFQGQFLTEKFWQTLPGLLIMPCSRIYLLFGIFFSHLILISIPFITFFIICFFFSPISFFTFLTIILLFLLLALIFGGLGLIFGIFVIANENISIILGFIITIFFLFSCISYPFELYPDFIQEIVKLNPLYYIFDTIRYVWIENDIIKSINSHSLNFIFLILSAIILPSIGVIIFNIVFKKYGIVGA